MMDDVDGEVDGAIWAHEIMNAAADLRSEIDAGGIGRRNVGSCEEDAAGDMQVGHDALIGGEIPTEDEGLDDRAIDRAVGSEDGVDRHDFDGVFEIAADWSAGEKVRR